MSEPSSSEPRAGRPSSGQNASLSRRAAAAAERFEQLLQRRDLQLALFLWLAPIPGLLLELALEPRRPLFLFDFFFLGVTIEFCLALALIVGRSRGLLSRRRAGALEYFLRTIIGLPFTVYLASAAHYGGLGLLRLLPALYLLTTAGATRHFAGAAWHLALFGAGLFAYRFLADYALPGERDLVVAAIILPIGAAAILREGGAARRLRRELLLRRDAARAVRRQRSLANRERALVEALVGPEEASAWPDLDSRSRKRRAPVQPMVAVAVCAPDLAEVAQRWTRPGAGTGNSGDAAELASELQREWDKWRAGLEERLRGAGLQTSDGPADGILGFAGLPASELQQKTRRRELYALALGLREFAERFRRSLASRGRLAWGALILLEEGPGLMLRAGARDPRPALRGPLAARILGRSAGFAGTPAETAGETAIQLGPELGPGLAECFAREPGTDADGWMAPGLLRGELSEDGEGVRPAPSFYSV